MTGNELNQLRAKRRMTQAEYADFVGVARMTIVHNEGRGDAAIKKSFADRVLRKEASTAIAHAGDCMAQLATMKE